MEPLPFLEMLNPVTKRMKTRKVDVDGEGYECARRYMIRLEREDLEDPEKLKPIAEAAGMDPEAFRARYEHLVRG
jgi:6-phosphofructokinase 1